jgi:hypothetical protein
MRISSDPNDPRFCKFAPGRWLVTVDEREAKGWVTADEERGFVLLLAVNDQGNLYLDDKTPHPATFTYHGVVKIREKKGWQPEPK